MVCRIALLVVAALLSVLGSVPAAAVPSCGFSKKCATNYYTDSTLTSVVGGKITWCNNTTTVWGVVTPYSNFTTTPCTA